MSMIMVNTNDIMHFGKTYRDVSTVVEGHRRALHFNTTRLDQQMAAFGISLHGPNLHGTKIGDNVTDIDARVHRVSIFLNKVSGILFRHAGDAIADQHFSWTSAFLAGFGHGLAQTWDELGDLTVTFLEESRLPGALNSLKETSGIAGTAAGGLIRVGGGLLGGLQAIEGYFDLISSDPNLSSTVSILESGGDLFKMGSGIAGIALAVTGAPITIPVFAAGIIGWGSDFIFENWDPVTHWWDTHVAEPVADTVHNVLDAAGDLWDSTVDLVGGVIDNLFHTTESILEEAWYAIAHNNLTEAAGLLTVQAAGQPTSASGSGNAVAGWVEDNSIADALKSVHSIAGFRGDVKALYDATMTGLSSAGMRYTKGTSAFDYFRGAKGGFTTQYNNLRPSAKTGAAVTFALSGLDYAVAATKYGLGSSEAAMSSFDGILSVAVALVPGGGIAYEVGKLTGSYLQDHTMLGEAIKDASTVPGLRTDLDALLARQEEVLRSGDFEETQRLMDEADRLTEKIVHESTGYKGLANAAGDVLEGGVKSVVSWINPFD
jgi:hypothetical protein